MKLYQHPVSTSCRPVMMFIADEGIDAEQQIVDILTGEQYGEEFTRINPSSFVPVLEDGDFRLIEVSAILKYLAEKTGSATYPSDPQARARVNEAMDWVNTNLYRSFGYGLVYPQVLEYLRLPDDGAYKLQLEAGMAATQRFMKVLNDHMLGGGRKYLCGDELTIADYLLSGVLSLGEVIGCTFDAWPNVKAWYARMLDRPNWQSANAGVYQWAEAAKGPDYVRV